VTHELAVDPVNTSAVRSEKQNADCVRLIKEKYTKVGDREREMKALSLHDCKLGTRGVFFGICEGGEDLGINGACVPDMLHQYLLGEHPVPSHHEC
jgi:hypothetical protein